MTAPDVPIGSDKALTERLDKSVALRAAGLGVWEFDPATSQINWDDRCCQLYGLAKSNQIAYEEAIRHIHPDDVDAVDKAVQWALDPQSGGEYDATYRTIGVDDGLLRWVHFWGQSYLDETGHVYRLAGVAQDVTKEARSKQLEESERRFRTTVEQAPVAIAIFRGPEHVVELANEAHLRIWGRTADQVLNKPIFEALPEAKGQGYEELLANVLTTGNPFYANELSAPIFRNGQLETVYFNFVYQPLHEVDGTITGVIVAANEITEQVMARQKIREAEETLRTAIDLAELGTWEYDLTTGISTFSDQLRNWFGFKPDEVITPERGYLPIRKTDWPRVAAASTHAITPGTNGLYDVEYTLEAAHAGQERIIHAQGKVMLDEQGKAYKIRGTAQDVTQQRQLQLALEQQVQQRTQELAAANEELSANNEELASINEELTASAEELLAASHKTEAVNEELIKTAELLTRSNESLQQFAYVASHDLQEPLRKIQQFGDILKKQFAAQLGDGVDYLDRMQTAARRMSTLIHDLLAFSRIATQQDASEVVTLSEVLDTVLVDLDLRIQDTGATIIVEPLPTIMGDPSQLGHLFQNLLSNALKFRRPDVTPHIQINTTWLPADQLPNTVRPGRVALTYYRIDVADNGIGFDEKYLDRIFQVFQRLHGKNEFAGTGVGLAICEKVVANHGGAITATSRPGQGATFSVYFPA